MGAPHLEGSQLGGAQKSAFRPVCPPQNAPPIKPAPSRGCHAQQGVQEGPVLFLWTRDAFVSSSIHL